MATRLYISDRFITDIDELRLLIEEVGNIPSTPVARQLIAAACDGVLSSWLQDTPKGNEREISLSKEQIATLSGDNERWKFIKEELTGKVYDSQWNWREKIDVKGPEDDFWDGLERGETVHLKFSFRCKEVMDEQIELQMLEQRRTIDMNKTTQEISFNVDGSIFKGKILELFKHGDLAPIWRSEREQFRHKLVVIGDRSNNSNESLNEIDVCNLSGASLTEEKFLLLTSDKEWICATNKNKSKLFLIVGSKICDLGPYDAKYSVSRFSTGGGITISYEGKILSSFFILDNECVPEYDFYLNYAKKRNLSYFTIRTTDGTSQTITVKNEIPFSLPSYKSIINIGNLSGDELFWAKNNYWSNNENAKIINEKGDYIRLFGHNGDILPIGEKKYIACNTGHKYSLFLVYSLDGQIVFSCKLYNNHWNLSYENDNETSYILNEQIRYIKRDNQLISCASINQSFYIKKGVYVKSDYNESYSEPELCFSKGDIPLFKLEETRFVNFGNGYFAVRKKFEMNDIVVSPQGKIIYELKNGETISCNDSDGYRITDLQPIGTSTKHIIVKATDNNIKIYTLSGEYYCSIKTHKNEEILGFENSKLFVLTNGKLSYYNTKGEKHTIINDKDVRKEDVKVLPNGNLLVDTHKGKAYGFSNIFRNSSFVLLNPSGKVLLEKSNIKYL